MKNVLVTGGAGFIGSRLVDRLLEQGNNVICVDNFDPYYDRAIKENNISEHRKHNRYRLVEEDVRDLDVLRNEITEYVDVIVHLAILNDHRRQTTDHRRQWSVVSRLSTTLN